MEYGPWTIVHGINRRVAKGKWTMDYSQWYRPLSMANRKWTMDYSHWYQPYHWYRVWQMESGPW